MMTLVVNDPELANELIAERKAKGLDRYDEVWEGVYMMSPLANNEHQWLATEMSTAIATVVDWQNLGRTLTGANVSDRRKDWKDNYRIPDVLVFQSNTSAEDCQTHWFGGPELAIEIVSPGDRTLDKLDFYAAVGTQELLVIDRDPWRLTLYRRQEAKGMVSHVVCTWSHPVVIHLEQFPVAVNFDPNNSSLNVMRPDSTPIREIPIRPSR